MICEEIKSKEFIEKAKKIYGDKYEYTLVRYINAKIKVKIICKEHGIFEQIPDNHIRIGGCNKCGVIKRSLMKFLYKKDRFIENAVKIHGSKYDYSLVEYIGSTKKVNIICKEHGVFRQMPAGHLSGKGCYICNSKCGLMENKWLDSYNIPNEYRQYIIENYRVDGINIKDKIIYEFYGDYWHGNPEKYNPNDINKSTYKTFGELYNYTIKREEYLKSLGYIIISIWESDYNKKLFK
jgi:very-short-patch-repair endonuclease